jgi:DNA topoisomerase-1
LGDHPTLGGVAVKNGRYGAYVTAGGVNATIPSDKTVDTITLPEAIALIDERVAKGGGKPKRGVKKAKPAKPAKAEASAPKAVKKAAAKKSTTKPKSEAVSKARGPATSAAKTSAAKPAPAAKPPAKKSAGKARG